MAGLSIARRVAWAVSMAELEVAGYQELYGRLGSNPGLAGWYTRDGVPTLKDGMWTVGFTLYKLLENDEVEVVKYVSILEDSDAS